MSILNASSTRSTWTRAAVVATFTLALAVLVLAVPAPANAVRPARDGQPLIESLSAYSAPPGTVIQIVGSGFGPRKTSSYVIFAGERAPHVTWGDSIISVEVPPRAQLGYVGVVVDGVVSNGMYFVPEPMPEISGLTPTSAAPNGEITIVGRNFGHPRGEGAVTFAGSEAAIVSWSDTTIVARVPENARSGYVGVWQRGVASNGVFFVPGGAPAIDTLSDTATCVGAAVTLSGRNFGAQPESAESLTVGGVPVPPTTWTDTQITFTVPSGTPTGYVGVWKGPVCSNGMFLLVGPRIDALSSWWGEPGSSLTITGSDFGWSPSLVTIGGVEAPVTSWTDTRVVVTVPENAPEGLVGVWRDGAASNGLWFLPLAQPRILALDRVTASPGDTITITGAHFASQTTGSRVTLGGIDVTVNAWTDTQIVATLPADATSGYVGVWQRDVASNGVWLEIAAPLTP